MISASGKQDACLNFLVNRTSTPATVLIHGVQAALLCMLFSLNGPVRRRLVGHGPHQLPIRSRVPCTPNEVKRGQFLCAGPAILTGSHMQERESSKDTFYPPLVLPPTAHLHEDRARSVPKWPGIFMITERKINCYIMFLLALTKKGFVLKTENPGLFSSVLAL